MAQKHQNIMSAVTAAFRQKFGLLLSGNVGVGVADGIDISLPAGWVTYQDDQSGVAQPIFKVDASSGKTIFNNSNGQTFSTATTFTLPVTLSALNLVSVAAGLTAAAGGTQAAALALTKTINQVSTVATAADSVRLPAATVGSLVYIINNGANALQAFGAGTDTINSVATATGIPQAAGAVLAYYCAVAGNWLTNTASLVANVIATGSSSFQGALSAATAPNYIATETGANNGLVAALLDAQGVAVPVVAGLQIAIKLAHTLQAGANTLNLNGSGTKSIKKASNPATDVAVTAASGSIISMIYDGTVWQVVGQ